MFVSEFRCEVILHCRHKAEEGAVGALVLTRNVQSCAHRRNCDVICGSYVDLSGCCFLRVQVTREVFEAAKGRLKVVGRAGVGVDNVDLTAATEVQ